MSSDRTTKIFGKLIAAGLTFIICVIIPVGIVIWTFNYFSNNFINAIELPIYKELDWNHSSQSPNQKRAYIKKADKPQAHLILLSNGSIQPNSFQISRDNDLNVNRILLGYKDVSEQLIVADNANDTFNKDKIEINSLNVPPVNQLAVMLYSDNPLGTIDEYKSTTLKSQNKIIQKPLIISMFEACVYCLIVLIVGGVLFSVMFILIYSLSV
jgi:hypothetical protein